MSYSWGRGDRGSGRAGGPAMNRLGNWERSPVLRGGGGRHGSCKGEDGGAGVQKNLSKAKYHGACAFVYHHMRPTDGGKHHTSSSQYLAPGQEQWHTATQLSTY